MANKSDFWAGILIGAAAGAVGSILATSDKGKEVREDLIERAKRTSEKLKGDAEEKINNARDEIADLIDDLRARLETLEEKVRTNRDE